MSEAMNTTAHGLLPAAPAQRLKLADVTLCAVSSSNVAATIAALETSLAYVEFAETILFTHVDPANLELPPQSPVRVVHIARIKSSKAYSHFVLQQLADHIETGHCLIAQWDGHVINPAKWRSAFLDYDYIGASWPQFDDGHDVGNGGFSLRSRRLMEACRLPEFAQHHPEDLAICRTNRALLEDQGMRFAPKELADAFSAERAGKPAQAFGYHGVFLMPRVLGADRFWQIYRTLDDRATLWLDFGALAKGLRGGSNRPGRILRMALDRVRFALGLV